MEGESSCAGESDRCSPSPNPPSYPSVPLSSSPGRERRATPARAVAAVMAAHANQHGAETPSRATLPATRFASRVYVYAYVCTRT